MSNDHIRSEIDTYRRDLADIRPQLVQYNEIHKNDNVVAKPGVVALTAVDGLIDRLAPADLHEAIGLDDICEIQTRFDDVITTSRMLLGIKESPQQPV